MEKKNDSTKAIIILTIVAWLLFGNGFSMISKLISSGAPQAVGQTIIKGAGSLSGTAMPTGSVTPTTAPAAKKVNVSLAKVPKAPRISGQPVVVPQGAPSLPTATPEPTSSEPTVSGPHNNMLTAEMATSNAVAETWVSQQSPTEMYVPPTPTSDYVLPPVYEETRGNSHGAAPAPTVPPADTFEDPDGVKDYNCSPFITYLPGHECYGKGAEVTE